MALVTGSGLAALQAVSALPLTCHLTVILRTMRNNPWGVQTVPPSRRPPILLFPIDSWTTKR
jgi:hypothetical protein